MTFGAICANRSTTVLTPNSMAADDHTAPVATVAIIAIAVSGTFGMYDTTRSPGFTPMARSWVARMRTWDPSVVQVVLESGRISDEWWSAILFALAVRSGRRRCSA